LVSAAILEIGFSSPFHSYIRFGKRFPLPGPTALPVSLWSSPPVPRAHVSFMTYSPEPPYLRCFRSNTPTSLRNIAKRFFRPRRFLPPVLHLPLGVLYRFGPFRRICNITLSLSFSLSLSLWPFRRQRWQAGQAGPSEILIIKSTERPPSLPSPRRVYIRICIREKGPRGVLFAGFWLLLGSVSTLVKIIEIGGRDGDTNNNGVILLCETFYTFDRAK